MEERHEDAEPRHEQRECEVEQQRRHGERVERPRVDDLHCALPLRLHQLGDNETQHVEYGGEAEALAREPGGAHARGAGEVPRKVERRCDEEVRKLRQCGRRQRPARREAQLRAYELPARGSG